MKTASEHHVSSVTQNNYIDRSKEFGKKNWMPLTFLVLSVLTILMGVLTVTGTIPNTSLVLGKVANGVITIVSGSLLGILAISLLVAPKWIENCVVKIIERNDQKV